MSKAVVKYWSFKKARAHVRKLHLTNTHKWIEYAQSGEKPEAIPSQPHTVYKNQGWIGYRDWLVDTRHLVKDRYLAFNKAKRFARGLKLENQAAWADYAARGDKPDNIPSCPERIYAEHGWVDYFDWLGSTRKGRGDFLPYDKAKKVVHKLNLTTKAQWLAYIKEHSLPDNIPKDPYTVYRGKGYVSMGDWLGTGTVGTRGRSYRSFRSARAWVRKQKFSSYDEWINFARSGDLPDDIPRVPNVVYASHWQNFPDWLGNKNKPRPVHRPERNTAPTREFKAARRFVRKLKLTSSTDWVEYTRSGQCPADIPSDPRACYHQFIDMADWLGVDKRKRS